MIDATISFGKDYSGYDDEQMNGVRVAGELVMYGYVIDCDKESADDFIRRNELDKPNQDYYNNQSWMQVRKVTREDIVMYIELVRAKRIL